MIPAADLTAGTVYVERTPLNAGALRPVLLAEATTMWRHLGNTQHAPCPRRAKPSLGEEIGYLIVHATETWKEILPPPSPVAENAWNLRRIADHLTRPDGRPATLNALAAPGFRPQWALTSPRYLLRPWAAYQHDWTLTERSLRDRLREHGAHLTIHPALGPLDQPTATLPLADLLAALTKEH